MSVCLQCFPTFQQYLCMQSASQPIPNNFWQCMRAISGTGEAGILTCGATAAGSMASRRSRGVCARLRHLERPDKCGWRAGSSGWPPSGCCRTAGQGCGSVLQRRTVARTEPCNSAICFPKIKETCGSCCSLGCCLPGYQDCMLGWPITPACVLVLPSTLNPLNRTPHSSLASMPPASACQACSRSGARKKDAARDRESGRVGAAKEQERGRTEWGGSGTVRSCSAIVLSQGQPEAAGDPTA